MKMNLPNKLTMLRVFLIPVFVVLMLLSVSGDFRGIYSPSNPQTYITFRWLSLAVFCIASITDTLDGYIARRDHLVTNFGKFMDPLADKLLVCSALILFTAEQSLPAYFVIIIIAREFIISGFRLIAADAGIVIAAKSWGKLKTVSQMILCIVLTVPGLPALIGKLPIMILMLIVLALTVISLIDYIAGNIGVLTNGGM